MKNKKISQQGFEHVTLIVLVLVLGVIGLAGYTVFNKKSNTTTSSTPQASSSSEESKEYVRWDYNGNTWQASSTPPKCESPLSIASPTDMKLADSVLLPGQYRGGDYKPHGGLGISSSYNNKATVSTLRDAYLISGARYTEMGEVQYMFDFIDPCGIVFRFDHLATLTPEFAAYAAKLPEPKKDDSRTTNFDNPPLFKKGTAVATEVGFKNTSNAGFDVGVYDLRQPNKQSSTELFKTDQGRVSDKAQSYYSVCWFDLLNETDRAIANSLPTRGGAKENMSDFCTSR